jgi:hypothetical protein
MIQENKIGCFRKNWRNTMHETNDAKLTDMEIGVHLRHCNQGENIGFCKYGEDGICPALHTPIRVDGERVIFNTKTMEIGKQYRYTMAGETFMAIKNENSAIDIYHVTIIKDKMYEET